MQTVSRLIETFIPEHYDISLALDRPNRTFSGIVTMNGQTISGATNILVHAKELNIETVNVDGKEASFKPGQNDEISISHPDIADGRHIVTFSFSGTITDAMHGLYPCYFEHDGAKKELLATQFESHHAREVFPCIDEPEAKATFDVTLHTEQNVTVLGNMPVKQQQEENGSLLTQFETTPKMSTYLLAWVVGELHKKTAVTKRGVEVNVWATPAQPLESLDFALDIAHRTIDFFDDYFATPYPLPKSDHVALPDFSSGAMENWGLVTYREIALLADPKTASVSSKHYIATVVAHELSHQWFGNLVTMKWWNNLWLNESFATIMEYIAVDTLHPEWNVWLDFATMESIMALRRDSLDGVQAVQVDVNHPDEISTLFDSAIVYAKGARLLRMLQQYIGNDAFQTGLKHYFAKHAYSNTEADDLWSAFGDASGKNITSFMNSWISQSGFPVVSIEQSDSTISLQQEQFFIGPHEPSSKLWPIPLNASSETPPELFSERDVQLPISGTEPLRLNVNDSAHFITRYDSALLAQHIEKIYNNDTSILNRVQLLHEQTLLAKGGLTESATLIPLLNAYKNETTEAVWDMMSLTIGELKKFTDTNSESEQRLRTFAGALARLQYERLGWEQQKSESESDTKLRATMLGQMLYAEDETVIREAISRFDTTPLSALDPELRALIIGTKVRHGEDATAIDDLLETYRTTASSELQQDIASGLTSSKDKTLLARILSLLKDQDTIRKQDVARWFVWTLRNKHGRELAWTWLQENWQWIETSFGSDKSYDDFPRYAGSTLSTREQLEEYRAFFTPLQSKPALTRVIAMGLLEIEGRVELIERDARGVQDELAKLDNIK